MKNENWQQLPKEKPVAEDKEKKARMIRLKIFRLQKELAASQQHARLGSFLHASRPASILSQADRDRKRIEEEIAGLKEQLAALIVPPAAPLPVPPVKKKKAVAAKEASAEKAPAKKKSATKKTAPKGAQKVRHTK
jgi:hypothetical protein